MTIIVFVAGRYNQNDFVVSSSGNVGIGTNSPAQKLDIRYPEGGGMALISLQIQMMVCCLGMFIVLIMSFKALNTLL